MFIEYPVHTWWDLVETLPTATDPTSYMVLPFCVPGSAARFPPARALMGATTGVTAAPGTSA